MYLNGSQFVLNKLHCAVMKKIFRCLKIDGICVEVGRTKFTQKTAAFEGGEKKVVKFCIMCSICMIR